jgi:hypothetical protein
MTEAGELRARLRSVEHDLEHVVRERDEAAAEAARLRAAIEQRAAAWEKQAGGWRALLTRDGTGYVVARELRRLLDGDR